MPAPRNGCVGRAGVSSEVYMDVKMMEAHVSRRPVQATIDLSAVEANARSIKNLIGENCRLAAVVKANGYGLGAVQVALAALRGGASYLAVACVDEGIELRLAHIVAPVLVMGYVPPEEAASAVQYGLAVTLHGLQTAQALEQAASTQEHGDRTVPVHIKVDTGLGRFGCVPNDVVLLARQIGSLPNLRLEGLMTHFAEADAPDLAFTEQQVGVYDKVIRDCAAAGINFDLVHAANSAAAIGLPEARFDMVRAGIALSGHLPSEHLRSKVKLEPVLSITSTVARAFDVCAGDTVGYGRTWVALQDSVVGLVPLGYADGYVRALSNRAQVLVRGRRCPVIGRVSMDQIAIDLTSVDQAHEGDEVVLIGRQGGESITADDLASWAGTISYEILCGLAPRLPRVYLRDGKVVGHRDLLGGTLAPSEHPHEVGTV
ncbi:MAG: alanine racemase [Chloroflexia bacterium]